MQKYADFNRHTRYAKLGGTGGKLVLSSARPRRKSKSRANLNPQLRLWLMIFGLLLICGFYIRYQALYVENSVFRDLYRLIYEHFLSKNPLPPIAINQDNQISTTDPLVPNPSSQVDSSSTFATKPTPASQRTGDLKNDTTGVGVGTVNLRESGVVGNAGVSEVINMGLYQPYLDFVKDTVKFIVISKGIDIGKIKADSFDERQTLFFQTSVNDLVNYRSKNKNIKNLFHSKVKLNNAWIENDTLILDFNSFFERSKYGYKGIDIRVQQILWTFLNFKNDLFGPIYYVSILIDGERKERIGGDGYTLKPFYSKKDLKSKVFFP